MVKFKFNIALTTQNPCPCKITGADPALHTLITKQFAPPTHRSHAPSCAHKCFTISKQPILTCCKMFLLCRFDRISSADKACSATSMHWITCSWKNPKGFEFESNEQCECLLGYYRQWWVNSSFQVMFKKQLIDVLHIFSVCACHFYYPISAMCVVFAPAGCITVVCCK
jgi:hypothetical protein